MNRVPLRFDVLVRSPLIWRADVMRTALKVTVSTDEARTKIDEVIEFLD